MSDWKRWVMSGALTASFACSGSDDASPDGGALGSREGGSDGSGDGATRPPGDAGGGGNGSGGSGEGGTGEGGLPSCGAALRARVRDFKDSHPDFEDFMGSGATRGLVQATLGGDSKPIHAASAATAQTSGPQNFAQWYNDTPGINLPIDISIPLTKGSAGYIYDNVAFFPIDTAPNDGFGREGRMHNYHFTTEIHTEFTYGGGERFTFRGDDDLWIFVNGKLALDLGGLHEAVEETIDFDAQRTQLEIVPGQTYRMDIFHAERRTVASNFLISTNIKCFTDVPILF